MKALCSQAEVSSFLIFTLRNCLMEILSKVSVSSQRNTSKSMSSTLAKCAAWGAPPDLQWRQRHPQLGKKNWLFYRIISALLCDNIVRRLLNCNMHSTACEGVCGPTIPATTRSSSPIRPHGLLVQRLSPLVGRVQQGTSAGPAAKMKGFFGLPSSNLSP